MKNNVLFALLTIFLFSCNSKSIEPFFQQEILKANKSMPSINKKDDLPYDQ
jgi:hypothetical protein